MDRLDINFQSADVDKVEVGKAVWSVINGEENFFSADINFTVDSGEPDKMAVFYELSIDKKEGGLSINIVSLITTHQTLIEVEMANGEPSEYLKTELQCICSSIIYDALIGKAEGVV